MFPFTWHSRASVFHLISFLHWHFFPPLSTCLNILKLFVGNAKSLAHKYQITNNQITNAKLLTHKPNWCQQHCSPGSVHTFFLPLPPQVFAQPERNTSTWCKTYIWLLRTWYDICADVHMIYMFLDFPPPVRLAASNKDPTSFCGQDYTRKNPTFGMKI